MDQALGFYCCGLAWCFLQAVPPFSNLLLRRAGPIASQIALGVCNVLLAVPVLLFHSVRSRPPAERDWDVAWGGGSVFVLLAAAVSFLIVLSSALRRRLTGTGTYKKIDKIDAIDAVLRIVCILQVLYITVEVVAYWLQLG